jgi:hypothetical protein
VWPRCGSGARLYSLSTARSGPARDVTAPAACAGPGRTQAAAEVSRLIHEARDLNLPVEPGVRDGRDSLVRWAVLLEEVIP